MGSLLLMKMTLPRAAGVIVLFFAPAWAWGVIDMAATFCSLAETKGIHTQPLLGYTGAGIGAVAPAVTVIAVWLMGRSCHRPLVRWGLVAACLLAGIALCCLGLSLISAGFPRS
jgi:hypothetical protein